MRFCDLFISYKIGLKDIKSTIPFTKLPLYRKIFVTILFASAIISFILSIFKLTWIAYIPLALGVISFMVFLIIDSFKRNLQVMLNEHYGHFLGHNSFLSTNVSDTHQYPSGWKMCATIPDYRQYQSFRTAHFF